MAAVEGLTPIIHSQISLNSHFHPKFVYRQTLACCNRCWLLDGNSSRLIVNTTPLGAPPRVSVNYHRWELRGTNSKNRYLRDRGIRVRANSSCEQGTDSNDTNEATTTENNTSPVSGPGSGSSSGSSRKESQGKGDWWWSKWQWQPIVQAQEVGVLLQLGMVMFVMRLLGPGIPLPGSEPMAPVTFVSVPYSEFLRKVNTNQVQKVEVDEFHIMFKLKNEVMSGVVESESGSGSSKLQESEWSRSVNPTKRIVYTTTRPGDIKTPYEKMLENNVEFGSPDKRSGWFLHSAVVTFLAVNFKENYFHIDASRTAFICKVECFLAYSFYSGSLVVLFR